jgi:heme-degrading monooxygenase HmoA
MIARIWRGATREADADAYLKYMDGTGGNAARATAGNRGVQILRRIREGRAEFVFISFWDSLEAIRRFAGAEPERAVFYPEDERYLIEAGQSVEHYEFFNEPVAQAATSR